MIKTVAGKRLLYVMAVDAEYGRHLAKLFTPVMIGVGPVEAAANLAYTLAGLAQAGEKPDLVVSLGSAGSARLPQAEVFQVSSVSYRDMDASPLGFEKGATPFLDLPKVIELPVSVPEIPVASLSTGANIVSGKAYTTIDADMVDMETYACLRACQLAGIPLFGLRGISDGASELQHVGDWTQYLHVIDEKLAHAVERLEAAIADGLLWDPDNGMSV
ncbi:MULTISPECIES: 5'-methylthioadenosine/S-adenosylhomocysteine nucleosidase [Brucella/Ochrobactrum group]|jgi:adenosylhomocysteine nucleosidase|uniref:MTA/SAH nucleosidase family protein n=1 Tax=Brucella anthropi (strain ATCC 49188 / DSM 6882 / CCUG 24695 / JCM 21032 / LMG 3331 / NBRC 15819 / NCTC 12168 / Alc 37) TaxID=439375 RepID=A6X3G1_BRUA4|nr:MULTISPECIES: 5'-methylthioadenosine/S-adenosylhomocysteine nucleosidase [Brucella/Ochrobactrum group]ABS15765.1 MTA/SAH nucleosidase family protein [Brucella anthropi ATCC 49188]AIK42796.1 phosphorylase superfamily protein [Brucella anthropi]KAB2735473.1 5'-methylthioadenosine/S-adenosylhomocysteine nucleosidase [Brucella anthropi]KAB2751309.1 5'-methylthioadenosine/S-adenosylhomocysteine nucleosidase [Brucella anthropi]KAB2761913.1 5'-methylthioadenosine/S-adenosylhomocysteine nucleosidas